MKQPVDRKIFDAIVKVMQTGCIQLDGAEADMSADQTIRIRDGKLTFNPPLKVKKNISIAGGWLGSIKVGSAIADVVFRAANDTIFIDLIGSPIDVELYPQDSADQMRMAMTMAPEAAMMLVAADSWETVENECMQQFCCTAEMLQTANGHRKTKLEKRRREVEDTASAVRQALTKNPDASTEEVCQSVLVILFPLFGRLISEPSSAAGELPDSVWAHLEQEPGKLPCVHMPASAVCFDESGEAINENLY
jgi:hypothetical protein